MRRLIAAIMLVVGMALMVVGVGSVTWWKPSPTVEATSATTSQSGIIATDPGVLELVNDTVRVTARAPGTVVEMAVASSDIATIWLGDEPHASITGLSSWTALSVEEPADSTAPEEPLSLQGSDLFDPRNLIAAEDSVELYFVVPDGDWSVIAVGQDGTTPELTMTWERDVSTPWAIPLMIAGIVLLAAGSALFVHHAQERAVVERRRELRERTERRREADATETSVMAAITLDAGEPTGSESVPRDDIRGETGGAFGAGILPPRSGHGPDHDVSDDHDLADESEGDAAEDDPDATGAEDSLGATSAGEGENVDQVEEWTTVADMGEPDSESAADAQDDRADGPTSSEWRSLWGFGPKEDR